MPNHTLKRILGLDVGNHELTNMNLRTCPSCDNKYSLSEYFKIMLRFRDLKHSCNNCDAVLTLSLTWRFLLGLIAFSPLLFARAITTYLGNSLDISFWFGYVLFSLFLILWALFVYSFDRFKLLEYNT